MKLVKLAYPLPDAPTPTVWRRIAALTQARRLPAPNTQRNKGLWVLHLHPDDYAPALAYLQAVSLELGLPPYNP